MKATEQTLQQIERTLKKIAQKLPQSEEPTLMTDIHLRVTQDSGEILVYDDNDKEITRCVVEQWIENRDEDFYEQVLELLRKELHRLESLSAHLFLKTTTRRLWANCSWPTVKRLSSAAN